MLRETPDTFETAASSPSRAEPPKVAPPPAPADGAAIARRRGLVAALNLASLAALLGSLAVFLAADGLGPADAVILVCFVVATPWTVLGFWNAAIGLVLLHARGEPARSVYPFFRSDEAPAILSSRTAIVMTLRNEPPRPSFLRLDAIRRSLEKTGQAHRFRFFVLSDTSDPAVARAEEAEFAAFRQGSAREAPAIYRRRAVNHGFKAGNIAEFLDAHGDGFDFFLPLDSDSVMGGDAILRMVETMERHPRIGLLQSLVVGVPAVSGFARIFQFGMRHGMRVFTLGAAWWNADCGSYWGHNAVIRVRPFRDHCRLPELPGRPPLGGAVLSHDQLEAAFMRRAGYEVRVLPIETESFEANPPSLIDFAKRDLRWCQGNMQYWRFLAKPGLLATSRFQILQAILMYLAPAAWVAMTLAAAGLVLGGDLDPWRAGLGLALFLTLFVLTVSPKLAGALDVALTPGGTRAYGGALRFAGSVLLELLVSMLMAPIAAVYVSLFLAGLPFGRAVTWSGQNRDARSVGWRAATQAMTPQTLFGLGLGAVFLAAGGYALLWAAPFVAGLVLAVPFTVATAAPALGRMLSRAGLFAIPEEQELPAVLQGVVPLAARRWHPHRLRARRIRARRRLALAAAEMRG